MALGRIHLSRNLLSEISRSMRTNSLQLPIALHSRRTVSQWLPAWRKSPAALQLHSPLKHPLISSQFYVPRRMFSSPMEESSHPKTMAHQQSLPRLPVPALHETIHKYLRYLQPLVPASDFLYAKKLIDKFMESNDAEKLQTILVNRSKNMESWLAEWWLYTAYLNYREPVVVNSNPGVLGEKQQFADENAWLQWCAKLVRGALDFKVLLDRQRLPVDQLGEDKLCMMQYYSIVSSCRIPGERQDSVVCYRHDVQRPDPILHIVVAYKNHFHALKVVNEFGQPLALEAILDGLKSIVKDTHEFADPIGLMTAENRNVWGVTYARLSQDPHNKYAFGQIHKALFMLCLDEEVYTVKDHPDLNILTAANMLHGGGHKQNSANRWFDKTLQFIVSRDGACGLNYEHAPAEGPPIISVLDFALSWITKYSKDTSLQEQAHFHPPNGSVMVEKLQFHLDQQTKTDLMNAQENVTSLVNEVDLHYLNFADFGKDAIKKEKLSPDAFFQVALQLAYYRLHSQACATYESGSTRKFQLGRTDTIRSCSNESVAFSQAMENPKCSWEKRLELMVEAISQHKRYTGQVIRGQGFDRHLLGLKLAAVENNIPIPKFLADTTYSKAVHYQLSTSQVAARNNVTMCFGAVVPDGYGVCYNPQAKKISAVVSSYHASPNTSSHQLAMSIETSLRDMFDLLSRTNSNSTSNSPRAKL